MVYFCIRHKVFIFLVAQKLNKKGYGHFKIKTVVLQMSNIIN